MANTREFNLSLLDARSLDDIADLAGFEVPVNGVYTLKFNTDLKVINDKDCIECRFEVVECIEQAKSEDKPTAPGTKFSTLHQLDNEIGMGVFKKMVAPLAAHFGENNLATLVTDTLKNELIIVAKIKRRADKEDPEKFYANVENVQLA